MRTPLKAGAAILILAAPASLAAQQAPPAPPAPPATAAEANRPAPPSTTTVVTDSNPATPTTVVRTDPGNMTAPPASAMNKDYPLCSRTVTDSCQNPGEGGAPGRSRALDHWPGEPASETRPG